MADPQAGLTNSLLDVAGLRVGHADRRSNGWLSGTTVVLPPAGGAVAGVDVRGGGPGTRETDALDPRNAMDKAHAIVLSGGSAFGLAAADGVMQRLFDAGIGFPVGGPGEVVPIVPGAAIFDLGRGGDFTCRPGAALGQEAYDAAMSGSAQPGPVDGAALSGPVDGAAQPGPVLVQSAANGLNGNRGAGTGAVAGGLKGGVGSASVVLADGMTVAALVVVNSVGSCVDPATGELYAVRFGLPGEFSHLAVPDPADVLAARAAAVVKLEQGGSLGAVLATTVAVVATDATLSKAQCAKVSGLGHDGMARAIRPVHTMFDGDTVFTLATGNRGAPDPLAFHALLDAAGDCVTRAIGHAMLAAESVETPAGRWRSYQEAFPSATRSGRG